ncbi:MAG: UDP-N-acetylmuramate dehydrogenase [Clostridia bacterium]|nr:UDP-N-acetylmuramate dehydrogenase [Clostridia bacterium]
MANSQIYNLLIERIGEDQILQNESMKKHTSFKIGGNAEYFVKAKNIEDIRYILNICTKEDIPLTIIGNGSNLLVKDKGIKGIVLKIDIDNTNIKEVIIDCEKYAEVTVGAGVPLGKLAFTLLKNNISGFEFASGIPGTIGGAVRMNAGAYGSEFKDIVIETTYIDRQGNIAKLSNDEQKFAYRRSVFKDNDYIIIETKLLLHYEENNIAIKEKMDEYKQSRINKQPIEYPSAGSTFKRGADFITAKLIDECGLKGYKVGDAEVSPKHAGFVINKGAATANDVLKLIEIVKKAVAEKFGKDIELEIEVVGE